jgi:hypothetical protein
MAYQRRSKRSDGGTGVCEATTEIDAEYRRGLMIIYHELVTSN